MIFHILAHTSQDMVALAHFRSIKHGKSPQIQEAFFLESSLGLVLGKL